MDLNKLLTRETRDGKNGMSYWVMASFGLLVIVVVVYFAYRWRPVQMTEKGFKRAGLVDENIVGLQNQASGFHVQESAKTPQKKETISDRGITPNAGSNDKNTRESSAMKGIIGPLAVEENSMPLNRPVSRASRPTEAAIQTAISQADDAERRQYSVGESREGNHLSPYAPLPRNIPFDTQDGRTSSSAGNGGATLSGSMIVYSAPSVSEPSKKSPAMLRKLKWFLPRGEWIPCYLLTNIETGAYGATMCELGVAEDVIFSGRRQLGFGTRILGTVASGGNGSVRTRIMIETTALRYPTGLEIPVSGRAKGEDRNEGVPAYYISPPDWVQVAPYVSSFLNAWMQAAAQASRQEQTLSVAGVSLTANSQQNFKPALEAQLAGANAIQEFLHARLAEAETRFGAHLVIPAGTFVWVQLTGIVDLTAAHEVDQGMTSEALIASNSESQIGSAVRGLVAQGTSGLDGAVGLAKNVATVAGQAELQAADAATGNAASAVLSAFGGAPKVGTKPSNDVIGSQGAKPTSTNLLPPGFLPSK